MFTGIVEEVGEVVDLVRQPDAARLTVRAPRVVPESRRGDSVAVDGCCLTVAARDSDTFTADVMQETLDRTSLGALVAGAPVNLERAVGASARLGGHVVQGHVDGVGTILHRVAGPRWHTVRVGLPPGVARYVAVKGSIAVDGVSLTVVDVDDATPSCTIALVPTTLEDTTLGRKAAGDPVNVEVDVIAKYVERLLTARESA